MAEIRLKLDRGSSVPMDLILSHGDQIQVEVDGEPLMLVDVVAEEGEPTVGLGVIGQPDAQGDLRVIAFLEREVA